MIVLPFECLTCGHATWSHGERGCEAVGCTCTTVRPPVPTQWVAGTAPAAGPNVAALEPRPAASGASAELDAAFRAGIEQGRREVAAPEVRRIKAAALREYADRHHPHAEGTARETDCGTGVEWDAVCVGCDASWYSDGEHLGCTERVQLLTDADAIEAGEAPHTEAPERTER